MKKFPTFPASDLNEKRWLRKEQVKRRKKKNFHIFPLSLLMMATADDIVTISADERKPHGNSTLIWVVESEGRRQPRQRQ